MSKVNEFMTGSKLVKKKHTHSDQKAETFSACKINFFVVKKMVKSKLFKNIQWCSD